jgi:hypothetical protein
VKACGGLEPTAACFNGHLAYEAELIATWKSFWEPGEVPEMPQYQPLDVQVPGVFEHAGVFDEDFDFAREDSLFVTANGRLGMAGAPLCKDDKICVTPGFELPFILRADGGHHRFVMVAFVLGLMDGEGWTVGGEGSGQHQEFEIN